MKDCLDEGRFPLPNKYLVGHIRISALGDGRHDVKSIEIDSHANKIVIGSQGSIIQATLQCDEVEAFSDEVLVLENLPIVDAIIAYDIPYSMTTYLIIAKNSLNVTSMSNDLITTFIMRESGLIVNEIVKVHVEFPTEDHHYIYDATLDVRILLSFTGTFSYSKKRSLTNYEIKTVINMM